MMHYVVFLIDAWESIASFLFEKYVWCIIHCEKNIFNDIFYSLLITLHILITGWMVQTQCVRFRRRIDAKHERRKVNISIQLFVTAQKMEKVYADSFLCTGQCQNEYYKWKSLTQPLQYIFNEDSSENATVMSFTHNIQNNFRIVIDADWRYSYGEKWSTCLIRVRI